MTIGSDQLVNQAAKIRFMFGGKAKVPMVVRSPAGSGTGAAGHHSRKFGILVYPYSRAKSGSSIYPL